MEEQNNAGIVQIFDETLAKHMAATVTSGPGGVEVPVSLNTISCLALIAERESEMEMFAHEPPQRYTRATFLQGLEDLGIDVDATVRGDVEGLINNGLIDISPQGEFKAKPRAMELAKKVDEAFSGMPAISLIAYLVQTIDEVLSGRKELTVAVDQLDQTLARCENGPDGSKNDAHAGAKPPAPHKHPSADTIKAVLAASLRRRQTEQNTKESFFHQPKIVTSSGEIVPLRGNAIAPKSIQTGDIEIIENDESEQTALYEEAVGSRDTNGCETEKESLAYDDSLPSQAKENLEVVIRDEDGGSAAPVEPDNKPADLEATREDSPSGPSDIRDSSPPLENRVDLKEMTQKVPVENPAVTDQKATLHPDDDMLEDKIAAFEQQLAMICPVCGVGRIEQQETGKGKTYYRCSSEKCVFISWGRPYHQVCPACKNPFLIEATGEGGANFLKCPRATCRYRQPLPGETDGALTSPAVCPQEYGRTEGQSASGSPAKKRRVVRRRVVRRKK
jgi:hypothetical protein